MAQVIWYETIDETMSCEVIGKTNDTVPTLPPSHIWDAKLHFIRKTSCKQC